MNYNVNNNKCQIACNCDNNNVSYLVIPSTLERFVNTKTKIERQGDRDIYQDKIIRLGKMRILLKYSFFSIMK